MASHTINGGPWPQGATVKVFNRDQTQLPTTAPAPAGQASSSPVTSAAVGADGAVTFAGLDWGTTYWAISADGVGAQRWVGFKTLPDPTTNDASVAVLREAPLNPLYPEFGGQGLGLTDESAALRATISALPTIAGRKTGSIWLPPNTRWKVGSALDLTDMSGVVIECPGGGVSADGGRPMLEWTGGASSGPMILGAGSYGLHLNNVAVVYSNAAYDGDLVKFGHSGTGVDAFYPQLERCYLGGISGAVSARSIVDVDGAICGTVRASQFINAVAGLRGVGTVGYAIAWNVEQNTWNRCSLASIYNVGEGWHIHGANAFEPRADGSPSGIVNDPTVVALGVVIDGNWFGDVSGGAAGAWIDLRGRGIKIAGNRLHVEADAASGTHAAVILRNALGAVIEANNFSSAGSSQAVNFQAYSGNLCDGVSLVSNRFTSIVPIANVANLSSGEYRSNVGLADAKLGRPSMLATYTVATRPAAASFAGGAIFVSDAAAGQKLQYSDGAAWVAAG